MTTLATKFVKPINQPPRWTRKQIEAAVLAIPLIRFGAALKFGESTEDGFKQARATMADDIRRKLVQLDEEANEHS